MFAATAQKSSKAQHLNISSKQPLTDKKYSGLYRAKGAILSYPWVGGGLYPLSNPRQCWWFLPEVMTPMYERWWVVWNPQAKISYCLFPKNTLRESMNHSARNYCSILSSSYFLIKPSHIYRAAAPCRCAYYPSWPPLWIPKNRSCPKGTWSFPYIASTLYSLFGFLPNWFITNPNVRFQAIT